MDDADSTGWSTLPPARAPDDPGRGLAPRILPLAIVALLWVTGAHRLAAIVLTAAVLVTTATSLSAKWRGRFEQATEWLAHHVGRGLSFLLMGLVQVMIFTPVSVLSRIVRTDPIDPFRGPSVESRWLVRDQSDRPLRTRPFSDERYRRLAGGTVPLPGSPRWIRGFVGTLVLLVLLDAVLGSVLVRLDREEPGIEGPIFGFDPADQEAMATQDRGRELMNDLQQVGIGEADPFMGWRFHDGVTYESELVNVTGGVRRTRETTATGDAAEVWFFGGSTMYGSGQRDDATIASVLVDELATQGIAINATNFGHPAYANWQAVQLLIAELTAGTRQPPDIVVVYDGFNDMTLQTQLGVHADPTHLFFDLQKATAEAAAAPGPTVVSSVGTWWADHSAVALAIGRVRDLFRDDQTIQVAEVATAPIETIDPVAAADAAVAIHQRGVDLVVALGEAYDFEVRFFWQPYLYTRDELTSAEQELVGLPGYDTEVWLPLTQRIRTSLTEPVVDLSDALDGEPESVYWDFVHTNEHGAAIVAKAMQPYLVAALSG